MNAVFAGFLVGVPYAKAKLRLHIMDAETEAHRWEREAPGTPLARLRARDATNLRLFSASLPSTGKPAKA